MDETPNIVGVRPAGMCDMREVRTCLEAEHGGLGEHPEQPPQAGDLGQPDHHRLVVAARGQQLLPHDQVGLRVELLAQFYAYLPQT